MLKTDIRKLSILSDGAFWDDFSNLSKIWIIMKDVKSKVKIFGESCA